MRIDEDRQGWIGEALQRYEGPLLRYVLGMVRDIDTARDVVQETFLKLCSENPEKVENHLAPWLYRVCRNGAIDSLRRENRMNPIADVEIESQETPSPTPAERFEAKERENHVLTFLNGLPDRQREAIRLKFQDGLSYREIGEITGASISHVGVLIHEGMKTLRKQMARLASEV